MELKYFAVGNMTAGNAGSNRTFMELKFFRVCSATVKINVLIVPLWN